MSPLLAVDAVAVRFGGVTALDGVSIALEPGTIVGLIGPNGAGKSTLFGVVSGLVRPHSGRVMLDGADITAVRPTARARAGIARTFQRLELFDELTVRQHVIVAHRTRRHRMSVWRDLVGLGRSGDANEREVVATTLALLGLESVADEPVHSLPLGTGRLVEMARAIATEPKIVLLDEPSSGLASSDTQQLAQVIARLRHERSIAVLLVEHDVEMVLGLADDVYVLDFGRVIAHGDPAGVRADPLVQAAYTGVGP
jgi:ABC-type branched-subunit amino acid transport system ATPase component